MNSSTRNRTLIFIILLLLVTNIALLAYTCAFSKRHPGEKMKDGFTNALKNEVGFSDNQIQQFTALKEKHWAEARADMDRIRNIRQELFDLTKTANVPDSLVMQYADSIAALQKSVEINTFHHFKAARQICTPEQQPKYDSLMKKIIKQGRPGRPGGPPPK
ncbi:hypothetical protein A8C56_19725 [Niabella ginsenosidivorans]|uniref:Heavy metal resistance protein n=1 Tax=Niabella ginsenosidivorans TaxID=1176587 RepID=A0A1A9I5M4_9BACT|nr:hypothetical protein [Niabella ginsenosidivorans]ANH82916.1 hypothetical protein A8C56_19725 [Niabella ginsenosidivorans]